MHTWGVVHSPPAVDNSPYAHDRRGGGRGKRAGIGTPAGGLCRTVRASKDRGPSSDHGGPMLAASTLKRGEAPYLSWPEWPTSGAGARRISSPAMTEDASTGSESPERTETAAERTAR